mmetsp:Transcript_34704/g.77895  ORF Transcript_34704/g.77895 Transcript_34704/m.77895 type:complete len:484 (+) Transcript_34704:57-1508(+)
MPVRAFLLVVLALWSDGLASAKEDTCSAIDGTCGAQNKTKDFWDEMHRQGLQLKLKRTTVSEKARAGMPAQNRTGMVLSDDVFYGRAIMKVPRSMLISWETTKDEKLRDELGSFLFDRNVLSNQYNITGEEPVHLLSLAYPLIAERRNEESPFRAWLDALEASRMLALELTERQRKALLGTTVEGACDEMFRNRDLIRHTAGNFSYFKKWPITEAEASYALTTIMRHSRVVHPHQDAREATNPKMYLFPLAELLDVQLNSDPMLAISFQEEILLDGKREQEMVVQIARRDMPKGEEVFLWPGKLSNSENLMRHGFDFAQNPVGIGGRNTSVPGNWEDNPKAKIRKEYDKYNCTSLEHFQLRFSIRGQPARIFVRCFRLSWFLTNGWYNPGFTNRLRELDKWPPPEKYSKDDWLAWTQADQAMARVILENCQSMKEQLRESMDAKTAEDFRRSNDPTDMLLWHLRSQESKTFKECVLAAKKHAK